MTFTKYVYVENCHWAYTLSVVIIIPVQAFLVLRFCASIIIIIIIIIRSIGGGGEPSSSRRRSSNNFGQAAALRGRWDEGLGQEPFVRCASAEIHGLERGQKGHRSARRRRH